ncbi:MAG: hypothetical protein ACOYMB_02820 [Patescibacteria group bacterium]
MNKISKLINKINYIHFFWIFFYLLLFSILINNGFSYLDPDFGWHLKVGQEISLSHLVPQINTYNYTYTGNWVDHEWLSNAILFNIYSNFGYPTLIIIFALLIILPLIALNLIAARASPHKNISFLIAFFQLFGVLASLPHFGIRIQELALIFVLILLILISYFDKTKHWLILFALPPLFYLWANLHASFLIGFFILISWICIKLLEKILSKHRNFHWLDFSNIIKTKQLVYLSIASFVSLFVTFLTPYGVGLYHFLIDYQNSAYLSIITEWLPQSSLPLYFYQIYYLAFGASALLIYFYYYCRKENTGLNIWKVFLTVIFLILSFKSRRHFPIFFIVSFGFIIQTFSFFFEKIRIPYEKFIKFLLILCFLLVITAQILTTKWTKDPFTSFSNDYPRDAVIFLKDHPQYLNGNILNNYGWGGFLIWTLPEKKLFIDGRLPQIKFKNWTFIQEYLNFFTIGTPLSEKFDKYQVNLVLLPLTNKRYLPKRWESFVFDLKDEDLKKSNYLRDYLNQSKNWKVIYQDQTSLLYFYSR